MTGASSGTGSGTGPPKTASELVNTNFGGAASVRQRSSSSARRVEVDAHADVEVGLGLAADDRGEMEHRVGVGRDGALDDGGVGEIAGDGRDARVGERRRGHDVEQHDLAESRATAARVGQRPALEQPRARRLPRKPAPPVITMRMAGPLANGRRYHSRPDVPRRSRP